VHGAPRRVVPTANQIHESPPFITVLREGFNCGWIETELVKIASDHVNPAGTWSSSGLLPAERARVEVQDSPRRMVRWHAKHMSIPADPAAGSQRGGRGLSGKDPHRFTGDVVAPVNAKNRSETPTVKAVKPGGEGSSERPGLRAVQHHRQDCCIVQYMRILVVREMDCWRRNGLRSACITFDDSARLRSISGLGSPLLVTVEPRYTNESVNSTAFPSMFRDGGSGPSPTCISLVFAQLTFKPSWRDSRS